MESSLNVEDYAALVDAALDEDLGRGDLTTAATVPVDHEIAARIVAKSGGVLAGRDVASYVFQRRSPACRLPRR